jgi:predicted nuclease of predicted toxin-antitoxin system
LPGIRGRGRRSSRSCPDSIVKIRVRFLVDAQLPPALAQWLRDAGHEACHVEDVNLRDADDFSIWRFALEKNSVLITKDEDFTERARQTERAPVILWLRLGNASNRSLREWFMPQLPQLLEWIEQGSRILEIR